MEAWPMVKLCFHPATESAGVVTLRLTANAPLIYAATPRLALRDGRPPCDRHDGLNLAEVRYRYRQKTRKIHARRQLAEPVKRLSEERARALGRARASRNPRA
jgi:hypothetical protein